MYMKLSEEPIETIGQLRQALQKVPDTAMLNIGTSELGFEISLVAYDGLSVGLESMDLEAYLERHAKDESEIES